MPYDFLYRAVDAFADALDLNALGFANAELNPEGRPPFKPADLLKLYMYGYMVVHE